MEATGVCPRMSNAQTTTNCKGEKCHYWDKTSGMCVEKLNIYYLVRIGNGLLVRISDNLSTIADLLGKIVSGGDEDGT